MPAHHLVLIPYLTPYAVDDDEGVVKEYGGQVVSAYRGDFGDAELLGVVEAWSRGSGR